MTVKNTTPVGRYPDGKIPYGLRDMAGNVGRALAFEALGSGAAGPQGRSIPRHASRSDRRRNG